MFPHSLPSRILRGSTDELPEVGKLLSGQFPIARHATRDECAFVDH